MGHDRGWVFNGPISKRRDDKEYPDWQEWLEKRTGEHVQEQQRGVIKEWQPELGGKNFRFVCWGGLDELKLWEPK